MKNFLRIIAIIFLVVVGITIIRSDALFPSQKEIETPIAEPEVSEVEQQNETQSETESLEDIVDASSSDEGIVILGGDGIPNN